jgi:hypothetical protein
LQIGGEPIQLLPLIFKDSLHQGFWCWFWHCYRFNRWLTPPSPPFFDLGYSFWRWLRLQLLLAPF